MPDSILVNSIHWQKENVKYLIEKHLWPMNDIKASEKMCISCLNELKIFHEFYVRIKAAHEILNTTQIINKVGECTQNGATTSVPKNSNVCNEEFVEIKVEAEQSYSEEIVLETENPLCKEHYEKTMPEIIRSTQSRRKRRPIKNMVEKLINEQKVKFNPIRKSKKYKESLTKLLVPIDTKLKTKKTNQIKEKCDSVTAENSNTGALDSNENCDLKNDEENEQQSGELGKKKRKNPDENTRLEYDKMIAEYFKIFCSVCQIPIENFIALRKHFREEHNKRGFVICCKKKIFTRPILVDHIQLHLDPNFFKCNHCDKIYSDRSTLDSHIKMHENGQRNHVCNACGKSFVGTAQLESHKLTHEPDYEKKFSCKECGKFFTTLYSLNYHIQGIHHNKYVKICDICGKTIRCRNSFKLHMEKHDNKLSTPVHCDICGLRLIDRRGLRRHKNSQHPIGGKKEYSCHICSKISPNLRALRTHVRFAHETGYAHKCTMCDKAFKRPEALREHMATHTGTPLYNCPWCTKTFISNGNMHNHRKKSHPKEWEEAQRQKYGGILP